jgi:hypothetical protein
MHEGGRRVFHSRKVDVARRLAASAPDLKPGKASIYSLIDGGRRIDRFAVAPHPLVPAFAKQPVSLLDHGLALGPHLRRLRGQDVRHRTCLAELFCQSLAIAARQGGGVILRGHPDLQALRDRIACGTGYDASNAGQQPSSCAAGRCCRATAAPRPSKARCHQTIGLHRRSGFPRSVRSDGTRCAGRGVESRKDAAVACRLRSRRREGLSGPIPNIPPGAAHPGLPWSGLVYGQLQRPVFPSALESAYASSRVDRSFRIRT